MEIVVRASVIFFFLWILMRMLGKRELAEMTPFELVLVIVMGDLVQQAVTQEDYSMTGAILAVGTMAVWILMTSYVAFRFKGTRRLLESFPSILMREGKILDEPLRLERMSKEELIDAARQQGISDLGDVRYAILEADGKLAFITHDKERPKGMEKDKAG